MKIVVMGYIVRGPLGGSVWHHFQYVLGLRALGHEVLFLEDSDDFPGCYDPVKFEMTTDPSYGLDFISNTFDAFQLKENWAYFDAHTNSWYGKKKMEVFLFCREADLVLNLSGINPVREWWRQIPCRVFVDTDPAFTQVRHLTEHQPRALAAEHSHFFSFGENIGNDNCKVPDDGFKWAPTRQPIFPEAWTTGFSAAPDRWTTIMQWDSYKSRSFNDMTFGMKSLSFKEFEHLPCLMKNENFEIALGSENAPSEVLRTKGWAIVNPLITTKTPWTFQQYIAGSKGEWTVAKQGYVASNCGWFSERSCNYLVSGKPVITQETGFSSFIPSGKGILSFKNIEEAVAAVEEVNADYAMHCKEARNVIEEYFDAKKVLATLLNRL
jgi:hypothetical protein